MVPWGGEEKSHLFTLLQVIRKGSKGSPKGRASLEDGRILGSSERCAWKEAVWIGGKGKFKLRGQTRRLTMG